MIENNSNNLETIDVGAINWFKTKNNYSEKSLKESYDEKLKTNPKNKKELKKLLEEKTKELKTANKIIYNFKQLRSTYKLIELALESFDDNYKGNTEALRDEGFSALNILTSIVKREQIAAQNYKNDSALPDFDRERKNLISDSKEIFKKYGFKLFEYIPKNLPWYRNVLSFLNSPTENVRKSESQKDEDNNEMSR